MRAVWIATLLLCAACGPPPLASTRSLALPAPVVLAPDWEWQQATREEGSLRLEKEHWHFDASDAGRLRGWVSRSVTFLSTDGSPFQCIQGLSYTLRARYLFEGTRSGGTMSLEEREVQTTPSPCEPGERPLRRYSAELSSELELVVHWQDGSQTLQVTGPPTTKAERGTIAGRWQWRNRRTEGTQTRLEREQWQLELSATGEIRGHYQRRVDVIDRTGAIIPCANASAYHYEDTYQIEGSRQQPTSSLREASVRAASHPCLPEGKRVLDAARATLYEDVLYLEWRGRRIQVLTPIGPGPEHRDT